jgi:hypothetical protein
MINFYNTHDLLRKHAHRESFQDHKTDFQSKKSARLRFTAKEERANPVSHHTLPQGQSGTANNAKNPASDYKQLTVKRLDNHITLL